MSARSASPCVVCGERVAHAGSRRGYPVGCTAKGVNRLVHEMCETKWRRQKTEIMQRWPELQPAVFQTLSVHLRSRIERLVGFRPTKEQIMPKLKHKPFKFPDELRAWIRERLTDRPRQKGDIPKWVAFLRREHPTWLPPEKDQYGYGDILKFVTKVEQELEWEKKPAGGPEPVPAPTSQPIRSTPPAETPEPAAIPAPASPPVSTAEQPSDLAAMVALGKAQLDLAGARGDRVVVETVVIMLNDHFRLVPNGHAKP